MVKDVKSNGRMLADEAGLVTLCATRFLSQSPKRRFVPGKRGVFWLWEVFREETILPVSEIVDYKNENEALKRTPYF